MSADAGEERDVERVAWAICSVNNAGHEEDMTYTAASMGEPAEPYGPRWTRYMDEARAAITAYTSGSGGSVAMTAADLGCIESKCQQGRGDPPMDCIWPDCPCGSLSIAWNMRPATSGSGRDLFREGVEAAAKVADAQVSYSDSEYGLGNDDASDNIAKAIRALSRK